MRIISHRGNLAGPDLVNENKVETINHAIKAGFDVEIDVWYVGVGRDAGFWLGHNSPQYRISENYLHDNAQYLWMHAKNGNAFLKLHEMYAVNAAINAFSHDKDDYTMTTAGWIWMYPRRHLVFNEWSIMACPDMIPSVTGPKDLLGIGGVCTDWPIQWRNECESL